MFCSLYFVRKSWNGREYRAGDRLFRNAKRTIKADPTKFSKATKLAKLHAQCSQAASHADYITLNTRMCFDKAFEEHLYFGIRENPQRFTASCWIFLLSHSLILNTFGDYLVTEDL